MSTMPNAEPSRAESLVASLAALGITLHTDGTRIWATPDDDRYREKFARTIESLRAEVIALLTAAPA